VGQIGSGVGPPDELVDAEVAIKLDSKRNKEFGFQLRDDDNKDANRGMLSLLRDAFNTNRSVVINYVRTGIRNGLVVRVEKPR
jgi:hypothetical protein